MTKPVIYCMSSAIFLLLAQTKLSAQSATVKIEQDSTITKLMATKLEIDTDRYSSKFYTIQLFYGDNKKALELFNNFKENFPNWEVDLSFETPNYKVQVGRFKDYYFGLNKLKEIKRTYPAAFLLKIRD